MDGSLVIMEGSLLSIYLLIQWMVALSLWKVVCSRDFFSPMDGSLVIKDGSRVIKEGSLLSRFLLLQWMVAM